VLNDKDPQWNYWEKCDRLLKLGLGADYYEFTASMKRESPSPQVPTFEYTTADYKHVILRVPDRAEKRYVPLEEKEAIRRTARPNNTQSDLDKDVLDWIEKMQGVYEEASTTHESPGAA
jgi:hypothetical protein